MLVGYLPSRAVPASPESLYSTSNYTVSYGAGLGQLDLEFQQSLAEDTSPLALTPRRQAYMMRFGRRRLAG
jgi:hypothetical protein